MSRDIPSRPRVVWRHYRSQRLSLPTRAFTHLRLPAYYLDFRP